MFNRVLILTSLIGLIVLGKFAFNYTQYKNQAQEEQKIELKTDIKVIIYSKIGCGYCNLAKNLLEEMGIPYESIELTDNKDLIEKLIKQTGQYTVPYIFVNDEFIGGYQDLMTMKEEGKI